MAAVHSTRARGIQIREFFWGCIIEGTREMLIQHGYTLEDGIFPGDPGARKTVERGIDPAGRAIKIQRRSKYIFSVNRKWTEDEAAAYEVAEEKRRAKREEIKHAKWVVDSWPKSAGAYRGQAVEAVDGCIRMMEVMVVSGCAGGYKLDDDAALRFHLISDQLRGLVENGKIVKDLAAREAHTPACMAETVRAIDAAKRDKTFQQFMDGVAK